MRTEAATTVAPRSLLKVEEAAPEGVELAAEPDPEAEDEGRPELELAPLLVALALPVELPDTLALDEALTPVPPYENEDTLQDVL